MKNPTDVLRDEHVLILRALDALETAADRLERGDVVPETWWIDLIAWLRAFADGNHHAREEHLLFPAMVKAGVPGEDGGPITLMLEEHEMGRALMRDMQKNGQAARATAAHRYISLLRTHIAKENRVLFPLADAVLDASAQQSLTRAFEAVEDDDQRDESLELTETILNRLAGLPGTAR
jgi:hemerythrin-like domain-containing protein